MSDRNNKSRAETVDRDYARYRQELQEFFGPRAWRPGSAEDLVQLVFERLLKNKLLAWVRNPKNFVYKIAWRVVRTENRRYQKEKQSTVSIEPDETQQLLAVHPRLWDDNSTKGVDEANFLRNLEALKPKQQLVFVLHCIDGHTVEHTAVLAKLKLNTTKGHLKKAMAHMYKTYGADAPAPKGKTAKAKER